MRKLVYYIAASLDGRIAGPHGEVDFYPAGSDVDAADYQSWINERYPETVPTAYREPAGVEGASNRRFDTVLMGRTTYRSVADHGITSPYSHMRQYMISRSSPPPDDPSVRLERDGAALVRRLKGEEGRDIWLCGGAALAGALLPEIDELIVKRYPVIAGAGPALADGEFAPTEFTLTDQKTFANGVTVSWFSSSETRNHP